MRRRAGLGGALAAAAIVVTSAQGARAAEPDEPSASSPPPSLRYVAPAPPDVVRAAAFELTILGVGFGEYMLDKSNSRDFDLAYDWSSLRDKLLFRSVAFDNNRFATNFVTHPIGGYFYYGAARAHRLTIAESLVLAIAGSTVWEYVGEWREQASVNDLVVTPGSGLPIGEAMFHLGAFFQRSRSTVAARVASWTFGGMKNVSDAIDDADPLPPPGFDAHGFPDDVWHHFHASTAVGATRQDGGATQLDTRVALSSRIVELPDYASDGTRARWFDEGEITGIDVTGTTSEGKLTDFSLQTTATVFGYYEHDVEAGRGRTSIVGLDAGFSYDVHDYDRDRLRPVDAIALVDGGLRFEHTVHRASWSVRVGVRSTLSFAGVGAYALPAWTVAHGRTGVTSVVANEEYGFAVGTHVAPTVAVTVGPVTAGAEARYDWFRNIQAGDRVQTSGVLATIEDRRLLLRAVVTARVVGPLEAAVSAEVRERSGTIGEVHAARSETSGFAGLGVSF